MCPWILVCLTSVVKFWLLFLVTLLQHLWDFVKSICYILTSFQYNLRLMIVWTCDICLGVGSFNVDFPVHADSYLMV